MNKYQVAIEKFDDNYNILKFYREDVIEFYLEKMIWN